MIAGPRRHRAPARPRSMPPHPARTTPRAGGRCWIASRDAALSDDAAAAPRRATRPRSGAREPPGRFAVERGGASAQLAARLDPANTAALEARIDADPQLAPIYRSVEDPAVARHLLLAFGAYLGDARLLGATGLSAAQPPAEIHSMAQGPLAAAGGLYEADMVADALASAGVEIGALGRALDFGCSSGRVTRVLAAAYPQTRWIGCDPNGDAVAWAAATFPADPLVRERERAPAPARRRRARPRLRDLDLVALRAALRPALARGDAARARTTAGTW